MIRYAENKRRHSTDTSGYSFPATENVRRVHRMIPGYQETDLRRLDDLAHQLGVKAVFVKDESARFGLKAFKGLGSVYAMFRILCRALGLDGQRATLEELKAYQREIGEMTFATTTDGNHGKGVSWAAALFGCKAIVYMPKGTVEVRAEAIRKAGNATVTITDLKYDDCVARTAKLAEENHWFLIQDTAWDGYEEIRNGLCRDIQPCCLKRRSRCKRLRRIFSFRRESGPWPGRSRRRHPRPGAK